MKELGQYIDDNMSMGSSITNENFKNFLNDIGGSLRVPKIEKELIRKYKIDKRFIKGIKWNKSVKRYVVLMSSETESDVYIGSKNDIAFYSDISFVSDNPDISYKGFKLIINTNINKNDAPIINNLFINTGASKLIIDSKCSILDGVSLSIGARNGLAEVDMRTAEPGLMLRNIEFMGDKLMDPNDTLVIYVNNIDLIKNIEFKDTRCKISINVNDRNMADEIYQAGAFGDTMKIDKIYNYFKGFLFNMSNRFIDSVKIIDDNFNATLLVTKVPGGKLKFSGENGDIDYDVFNKDARPRPNQDRIEPRYREIY